MQPLRRLGGGGRRGADLRRRCRKLVATAAARSVGRDEVPVEAPCPEERVAAHSHRRRRGALLRAGAAEAAELQNDSEDGIHLVLRRDEPYFLARRCRESSTTCSTSESRHLDTLRGEPRAVV